MTCLNENLDGVNPLIGRKEELERTMQILCRKEKNMNEKNPKPFARQNDCARNKKKNSSLNWKPFGWLMLIWLPILSGCANSLTHYDPIVIQPVSSAVIESSDASGFYRRVTAWRQKVKDYLKSETQD